MMPREPDEMTQKGCTGRVLALDYGRVHTGAAVSDPGGNIVRPLPEVRDAAGEVGIQAIRGMVAAEEAVMVVVGMPLSLSGERGTQAVETQVFIDRLAQALAVPVVAWDERFTSSIAREKGKLAGAGEHSVAACCLLEDYLGSESYRRRR